MASRIAGKALFDITPLLPLLRNGHVVITPNNRLRNHMRHAYLASHNGGDAQNAAVVMTTPAIYSLTEWIERLWRQFAATGHSACGNAIVSDFQRLTLWHQIVDNAFPGAIGSHQLLARQADEAYRTLERWQLTLDDVAADLRDEQGAPTPFARWAADFARGLGERQLITRERACAILGDAFDDNVMALIPRVYLQGFDDLPPLFAAFFQKAARQVDVAPALENSPASVQRTSASDKEQEWRAAAAWSREILHRDASARIGIIVPTLGQDRAAVERIFCETFEAQSYAPSTPRYALPFNISTGTPLAATPVIDAALLLLRLHAAQLPAEILYRILASPFWSDAENEIHLRAEITARLKRRPRFDWRTEHLRYHAHRAGEQLSPDLLLSKRLQTFEDHARHHRKAATPEVWARRFIEQLTLLNWPGTRPLDSVEYQQISHFHRLLDQFAGLEIASGALPLNEALRLLNQLAANTHFQAELKQSPIHILGLLEGAGLRFSHCWICGLDNNSWPARPQPNPLLPFALQRRQQMPRASVERELAYAQQLTQGYLSCADHIVVSYARQRDESEQMPSPLVVALPEVDIANLVANTESALRAHYRALTASQTLQWVACDRGPALVVTDGEAIRGGSRILKEQASCPFHAFAIFRLGAEAMETPCLGLSALDKGNVIHAALAIVWRQLQNRQALLSLSHDQQQALITTAVDEALHGEYKQHLRQLGEHYYRLETRRMAALLNDWLEVERRRDDFSVVGIEQEINVAFAGLPLKLRIDRVDRLNDNRLLLIDYKTGAAAARQWLGERPQEPQLPLYALCHPEAPSNIAFGVINAREIKLEGLGASDHPFLLSLAKTAGVDDWPTLVDQFRFALTNLADEYRGGHCVVDFVRRGDERNDGPLAPLSRSAEADFIRYRRAEENLT